MGRVFLGVVLILAGVPFKSAAQRLSPVKSDTAVYTKSLLLLPQNFYNHHLGFFCKKESQLQQRLRLPVYFRLGSKAYVDYLEQKPAARAKTF